MKIENSNLNIVPEKERPLLSALLDDLDEIQEVDPTLYIDWQDYHNEYSPERVDPCPDYYGYYTIRRITAPSETIGIEMTLDDLDASLCLLHNYLIGE